MILQILQKHHIGPAFNNNHQTHSRDLFHLCWWKIRFKKLMNKGDIQIPVHIFQTTEKFN